MDLVLVGGDGVRTGQIISTLRKNGLYVVKHVPARSRLSDLLPTDGDIYACLVDYCGHPLYLATKAHADKKGALFFTMSTQKSRNEKGIAQMRKVHEDARAELKKTTGEDWLSREEANEMLGTTMLDSKDPTWGGKFTPVEIPFGNAGKVMRWYNKKAVEARVPPHKRAQQVAEKSVTSLATTPGVDALAARMDQLAIPAAKPATVAVPPTPATVQGITAMQTYAADEKVQKSAAQLLPAVEPYVRKKLALYRCVSYLQEGPQRLELVSYIATEADADAMAELDYSMHADSLAGSAVQYIVAEVLFALIASRKVTVDRSAP